MDFQAQNKNMRNFARNLLRRDARTRVLRSVSLLLLLLSDADGVRLSISATAIYAAVAPAPISAPLSQLKQSVKGTVARRFFKCAPLCALCLLR